MDAKVALTFPIAESATGPVLRDNWLWHKAWCTGWIEALIVMANVTSNHGFSLEEAIREQRKRGQEVLAKITAATGDGGDGELLH